MIYRNFGHTIEFGIGTVQCQPNEYSLTSNEQITWLCVNGEWFKTKSYIDGNVDVYFLLTLCNSEESIHGVLSFVLEDYIKKEYVLVTFQDNWADEFDVDAFWVTSLSKYNEYISKLKNLNEPLNIYFGTNEDLEYESGEDIIDNFNIQKLSFHDYTFLIDTFGEKYGLCENIFDVVETEDEDEDED